MRFLAVLAAAAALAGADYDWLIRNARVVDGAGNPWFRADVAVTDGRIAAIGKLTAATTGRSIDAAGRVLAPGFIDVHTHVEAGVERFPGENFLRDGVTTVVTGNCGSSQIRLGEFFARLDKQGLALNLASLVGHNSIRREILGLADRQATAQELARMRALVEQAMRDGAAGFSTGLEYVPGTYSSTEVIVELARAAAAHGGLYATHMRDEGDQVLEAITEAARVGREAGLRVQVSHFKQDTRRLWGSAGRMIALVEQFRAEGVDVVVDQYPYEAFSTGLGMTLPSWALEGGDAGLRRRLADTAVRARIVADMERLVKAKGHESFAYARVASCRFDRSLEGRTIPEIALARGRPATLAAEIDTILEIMAQGGASAVYHSMSGPDVERILGYPHTAVASDGGIVEFGSGVPHPRSYGTNARVLAEYVGRRRLLGLEEAIRKMTSLPARTFAFRDRGLVREGLAADLVLFDPARVGDRATFDKPHQYADGFDLVLVNGVAVVEDGRLAGARPGRVLRRQ